MLEFDRKARHRAEFEMNCIYLDFVVLRNFYLKTSVILIKKKGNQYINVALQFIK